MQEINNAAGAVAGMAMFVLGISTIGWFVRKSYEGKRFSCHLHCSELK